MKSINGMDSLWTEENIGGVEVNSKTSSCFHVCIDCVNCFCISCFCWDL